MPSADNVCPNKINVMKQFVDKFQITNYIRRFDRAGTFYVPPKLEWEKLSIMWFKMLFRIRSYLILYAQ